MSVILAKVIIVSAVFTNCGGLKTQVGPLPGHVTELRQPVGLPSPSKRRMLR